MPCRLNRTPIPNGQRKGAHKVFDFTGKVIIVTGAAGSLGSAVARKLILGGARCALLDVHHECLQTRYQAQLPSELLLAVDLTQADSVQAAVAQVLAHWGRIDGIANIAGGFKMGPRLHETAEADWDLMLDRNARSVFLMCRAVIPHLLTQGGGKIVNIAARAALAGRARMAPYVVSKAAVVRLTESLACEYKQDHININCILPGTIDTPQNRQEMPNADFSQWVSTEALAEVVCFLLSESACAIHGAAIPVYGLS